MPDRTTSVLATSPPADEQTRVLKNNVDFAVFDHHGDIRRTGLGEEGIYHRDVRYLSCLVLTLNDTGLLPLGSNIEADGLLFHVDLTNPDLQHDGQQPVPKDTIHVRRTTFLHADTCRSRVQLRNYGHERIPVRIRIQFEADYVDIFEVRGMSRPRRGELGEPELVSENCVALKSLGLDKVTRRTRCSFHPAPDNLQQDLATFTFDLSPGEEYELELLIQFDPEGTGPQSHMSESFDDALAAARGRRRTSSDATIWTSSERANAWLGRSAADVNLMTTETEQGPYPYAGLPWFNSIFGRDGILTAWMYLWVNPDLARGVLNYLAAHQATAVDPKKDAEPGKILHEHREGEMAALGEVPFRNYYGTIDATPLFVMLAEAYFQHTADLEFIKSIWPNLLAALRWTEEYGDRDGDGLIEYQRQSTDGINSQGWKDSDDAIVHRDGRLAEPPIALCEVQAYVYAARSAGARLAHVLGDADKARQFHQAAEQIREDFETRFWCEELSTYAMALDRDKSQCQVKSSNPGHCLFAGIASRDRAAHVVRTLFSQECFSGWGIRTLGEGEARYNPMSYHNGSIWPHDNAIIAGGLRRYRFHREIIDIMEGLFSFSVTHDLNRLPELFCGFTRSRNTPPTRYPVACSPQAWAASSVFLLLQAALGMEIDACAHEIRFVSPVLPEWLPRIIIRNLRLGDARLDLAFERHRHDVGVQVLSCEGPATAVIVQHNLPGTL